MTTVPPLLGAPVVGLAALVASGASAQEANQVDAPIAEEASGAELARSDPSAPAWVVTLSSGILTREGDTARPFVVGGVSRRIGQAYVRVSGTTFRSAVRQIDAVLPSSYTIGSIGGGGPIGNWFVDGVVSAGHQRYGGVTTSIGNRPSPVGRGSAVYGVSLSGGRFVALTPHLYLTPSAALQYSANRTLRSALARSGPRDYETRETAWTGSATVRLDRFFGSAARHVAGFSLSRVQTSNGAVVLAAGGAASNTAVSVGDGWFVAGASASFRLAPRLWLDGGITRTAAAQSGDYQTVTLGLRKGF